MEKKKRAGRPTKFRIDDDGRECSKCGVYQPWRDYSKSKQSRTGCVPYCNGCRDAAYLAKRPTSVVPRGKWSVRRVDDHGRECTMCGAYKAWSSFHRSKSSTGHKTRCSECSNSVLAESRGGLKQIKCTVTESGRECTKCRVFKPYSEFPKNGGGVVKPRCSKCYLQGVKEYRSASPDENRRKVREWAAANIDKKRAAVSRWFLNNRGRAAAICARRRAAKKRAKAAWADRQKIQAIYDEAMRLTRETGIPHHVDHRVPLTHPLVQGLHVHENLRVITADENMKKKNYFDPDTFDLFAEIDYTCRNS